MVDVGEAGALGHKYHQNWAQWLPLIVFAGVVGELVLEVIAWYMAPLLLDMPMRPHLLVQALGQNLIGVELGVREAVTIHLILGILIMPMGYILLCKMMAWKSLIWATVVWGTILWIIAQGVLAPLAGRPVFLGFGLYSWASLVAHILYAIAVGFILSHAQVSFVPKTKSAG